MHHPPEPGLIEALQKLIGGAGTALVAATVGRLMWHAVEVKHKRRPVFGWFLVLEIPTAFGMAMVGDGGGEYLGLTQTQTIALISVLAYLGPRGIFAVLERWWDKGKAS